MHPRSIFLVALVVSFVEAPLSAQASWSRIYPPVNPSPRGGALLASHDATATVVLLWGASTAAQATDAWVLQGDTWSPMTATLPPRRNNAVLVYDSVRERLVLFGGDSFDDTWEFDGAAWQQMVTAVRPSARSFHAAAFDPLRGVTVVFGGQSGSTTLQDTWEWDGVSWVQRSPATTPPARRYALMSYDPNNAAVLMHGGAAGSPGVVFFSDTWTFDGVDWQQQFPATPPPPRVTGGVMVGDVHRQRTVLLGGTIGDPATWQWDGAEWSASFAPAPALRYSSGAAYDGASRRIVLFGGSVLGGTSFGQVDDTWQFRTNQQADVVAFGSGCAGSAGTPTLTNAPFEYPWLGDLVHTVAATVPAGELGALFASSFGSTPPIDLTPLGMPGCTLLVSPDVLDFAPAVAGAATWPLQVPNTPSLAGAQFRQQAFVLDAAANALGFVASNAIEATVGVR